MIEVLNTVIKCKIIKVKGPREARLLGFDTKNLPRGLKLDEFQKFVLGSPGKDGNAWS